MAHIASNIFFLLLVSVLCGRFETIFADIISLGSSLSPIVHPISWPSPSGRFAFGFYQHGDSFKVGIWLLDEITDVIVWTAYRDDPPLNSNARLQLTTKGKLLLQTGTGQNKLVATRINGTVFSASMLDSGNFVLHDKKSNIIWQSFDYPTDTLLGGQLLPAGGQLHSSSSETNQSSGRFSLSMQNDGNLVLCPLYSGGTPWDVYWSSQTDSGVVTGFKYYLFLNNTGQWPLCIVNASSSNITHRNKIWTAHQFNGSIKGGNIIYRATLHSNGVFWLYAHFDDENGMHQVKKLWSPPELENQCNVKSFCGLNSYCMVYDHRLSCNCIPGTDFIDPNQKQLGCKRNFSIAECTSGKNNAEFYHFSNMSKMSWGDPPYFEEEIPEEECPSSCLNDCYCAAALYTTDGRCLKQKLPLRYVIRGQLPSPTFTFPTTVYFKVGNKGLKSNNNILFIPEPPVKKAIMLITLVIFGFALAFFSAIAISSRLIYKIGALSYKRLLEIGDLGLNEGVTLRVFSYNELRKATNGFRQELGKGSFGSVYKGTLHKGRKMIAVKRLEKLIEEGEREFQAEMQAIGKTHHKNLVRLLGYCAEGSKRLLVYEFMSNGSLENFIFGDSSLRPDWEQKRRIALNIARGLLYLHEECEAPIIHCDIKPHNILMDEFLTAKISDFGLAKLLVPDQTRTFTQIRGTRGYLAPEWNKNTPITVKADVYSYGIMLLEIVFCRRSIVVNTMNPEQIVLSNWVYTCFVRRELNKLVLGEEVDQTLLEDMVKVGLWCIQDEPFLRPSMKSVVLMLEGVTDVVIPPRPSANCM